MVSFSQLSVAQQQELKRLGGASLGICKGCTNSVLCALERRGLARWELRTLAYWYITDLGRSVLDART